MLSKKNIFILILFIIIFLVLALSFNSSIKKTFEYDVDEGTNLIKSLLYLNGYSLYQDISNDQPPLFTVTLAAWLNIFGLSVYAGRILILLFSVILLWSFFQTIKIENGIFCAFTATSFLILSNLYLRLSVSIMIGLPALSLAMLSILSITLYKKNNQKFTLVLSGIFMALSLHIKLFTGFLIPIIIYTIIKANSFKKNYCLKNTIFSLFLWILSFLSIYIIILTFFLNFNFFTTFNHLISPHIQKIIVPGCDFSIIINMISLDYDFLILALFGIVFVFKQKTNKCLFPIIWLCLSVLILLQHRPIWEHYYTLISIPICWLAGITVNDFFKKISKKGWFNAKNKYSVKEIILYHLMAIIILLTLVSLPIKYNTVMDQIRGQTTSKERQILQFLLKNKNNINWIFTDRPIFAFYSKIIVPPELALIGEKRAFNTLETQNFLIKKFKEYNPEIILLYESKYYGSKVMSYIDEQYTNISGINSPKTFIWISRYIYWSPRWFRFLNKIWCYKLPEVQGGYSILKEDYDPNLIYIRKNISLPK